MMANTYTQFYAHVVFCPKYRQSLIDESWEERLYRYITGILQGLGAKMLAVNGMPDHIHILMGFRGDQRISDLVRDIKARSTSFINKESFSKYRFERQEGYGGFTVSDNMFKYVAAYIANQKEHHKTENFNSEYLRLLKEYKISYKDEYLFRLQDKPHDL